MKLVHVQKKDELTTKNHSKGTTCKSEEWSIDGTLFRHDEYNIQRKKKKIDRSNTKLFSQFIILLSKITH
jgi:hypothetical protein